MTRAATAVDSAQHACAVAVRTAEEAVASGRAVGLAVAVVHGDDVLLRQGFGRADVPNDRSIDPTTVFRIGSISKTLTAIGVARLAEAGVIGLDDPVAQHLRSIRIRSRRGWPTPTVRQLLTHTSGLGEWADHREPFRRGNPIAVPDGRPLPDLPSLYPRGLWADVPPGRGYCYANHGFAALGQLLAEVSGTSYDDYLRDHVLRPLGMRTADTVATAPVRARLAQGYAVVDGEPIAVPYEQIAIPPAGSVHADLDDMVAYVRWVAGVRTGNAIDAVRDAVLAPHWQPDPKLPAQGLGFVLDTVHGHQVVGHDGGWPGFVASMWTVPDQGFGVVVLTNTFDLLPKTFTNDVITAFVEALPAPAPRPDGSPGRLDIASAVGTYVPRSGSNSNVRLWREYGHPLRLRAHPDGLLLTTPKGPHADGTVLQADPADPTFWTGAAERLGVPSIARLRFFTDPTGRVVGFEGALPAQVSMVRTDTAYRDRLLGRAMVAGETALHLETSTIRDALRGAFRRS